MKVFQGICVVLLTCGLVLAQDTTTTGTPVKIAKKESIKVLKGVVVSVNTAAGTVVIKSWQSEDTLMTNEKTAVTVGNKEAITLADLSMGARVTAFYKLEQGHKVALRIIKKAMTPATSPPDSGGN